MTSFLSFAIPLALYLAWPSTLWNFDGVACAAALELGNPMYFFHANHLLYGFLGYEFWKYIAAPFGITRALPALQLFTSILSALGLIGLYRIILSITKNSASALLLTVGLSATAAFWVWSVEAQVYTLGFLPLAWATYVLLEYVGANKYVWVGLLHAAAVLGHLVHFLWAIPALYWMWGHPTAVRRYLTVLFLATVVPYALVIAVVISPKHDMAHTLIWLKGSAGLTPDRSWAWHYPPSMGPWIWLKSTLPSLLGSFWTYGNIPVSLGLWMLSACVVVLLAMLFVYSWKSSQEKIWRLSVIWLVVYGLFFSTWEPATLCYRLTDVIPLGILLALGLSTRYSSRQILLSFLLMGSTLAVNLETRIRPMHDIGRNSVYQEALTLSKMTPSNSLYITTGGPVWLYLLYFTGRTAWNANEMNPEVLQKSIMQQKRVRPVYVLKGLSWQKVR